jgi:hypothetical protein
MKLEGSCHCGAVTFAVNAPHPYPYNLCYCSICRKTAGGGGAAINLGAEFSTLEVDGGENIGIYKAVMKNETTGERKTSSGERSFCRNCGSALWVWDSRWPELVHPFASAIDTELPIPPQRTHLMLKSKAAWVDVKNDYDDKLFDEYPDESIAEWHKRLGLES